MNILQFLIDIRSRDNGVIGQVNRIQTRMDQADRTASRLNRTIGGMRSAFMSLPGAEFFTNPIVAITAGIGVVSKLGMDAGKTATAFNVLTGSVQAGNKVLSELNKYADNTIYDRLGVQQAAQTMLGFGVEQKKVMGDLRMLGDVAMGDKQRLGQLALVFGQVAAAGKLQGQDLLQLINAGYNPLLDISAQTGKSVAKLKDEMSKGMISFEDLRRAFERATSEGGRFYNMTNEIAKTPFGRWQQLVGEFTGKLLELYAVIEPLLIPAFNVLSSILSMTGPLISDIAIGVQWMIDNFNVLGPILMGIGVMWAAYNTYMFISTSVLKGWTIAQYAQITAMIIAEKVQWLLNIAMSANPIGLVISLIAGLVVAIIYCWNKFSGFRAFLITAWDTIVGFGSAIKTYIVDRFWEMIEGIGSIGRALVSLVKGDFNEAWEAAREGAVKLSGVQSGMQLWKNSVGVIERVPATFGRNLALEEHAQQQKDGISTPKAIGGIKQQEQKGVKTENPVDGKANQISTGGTRNTQITINISKFFDYINVTMMDKTDTASLQRIILEQVNRAIEIGTSSAR